MTMTTKTPLLAGWLEIPDAAAAAKLKEDTLRRYCHRGLIAHKKIGSNLLIHQRDLDRFQRERRGRGRPPKNS